MRGPVRFGDGSKSYTFPYPQAIRDNFAETQAKLVTIPGMAGGVDIYGVEAAPGVIGKVRLDFEIYTDDEATMTALRSAAKAMAAWGVRRLVYQPTEPTDDERWCWARIDSISDPEDVSRTAHIQRMTVEFLVASPYWYSIGTEAPLWGTFKWGQAIWGPTATKHGVVGSDSFTITPDGNAETLGRILFTTNAAQGFTNPVIRRRVDGELLDEITFINTTVGIQDCLIVNPRAHSVRKGMTNYYAQMTAKHPAWLRLEPGVDNDIEVAFGSAADSAYLQIAYYELWR